MPEAAKLAAAYESIRPLIDRIAVQPFTRENIFDRLLAAALVKNFEFNVYINREEQPRDVFFATATLRGMCEDLIVLKFLSRIDEEDRAAIAGNLTALNLYEGLTRQGEFFRRYRPSQPVLTGFNTQEQHAKSVDEAERFKRKYGWKSRGPLPSVWAMAKECGLAALYEYLYSATSKWVHFSPHILLRMGWGAEGNAETPFQFSTSHFSLYYSDFNRFYASFLFLEFIDQLGVFLLGQEDLEAGTSEIRDYVEDYLRWPESVTYEEMNLKGPSQIIRLLNHVARKYPQPNEPGPAPELEAE